MTIFTHDTTDNTERHTVPPVTCTAYPARSDTPDQLRGI